MDATQEQDKFFLNLVNEEDDSETEIMELGSATNVIQAIGQGIFAADQAFNVEGNLTLSDVGIDEVEDRGTFKLSNDEIEYRFRV